jgi:hypothetical protein
MNIIQFTEPDADKAAIIIERITAQLNAWSNFGVLLQDPTYNTKGFQLSDWQTKADDPTTYWVNYDAVFANLGDQGRLAAQELIGSRRVPGALMRAPICPDGGSTMLEFSISENLAIDGYLPGDS